MDLENEFLHAMRVILELLTIFLALLLKYHVRRFAFEFLT